MIERRFDEYEDALAYRQDLNWQGFKTTFMFCFDTQKWVITGTRNEV